MDPNDVIHHPEETGLRIGQAAAKEREGGLGGGEGLQVLMGAVEREEVLVPDGVGQGQELVKGVAVEEVGAKLLEKGGEEPVKQRPEG